jgi:hypothetical protein
VRGPYDTDGDAIDAVAKEKFDKAILALRTFKSGPVGYDYIHFLPQVFCPIGFGSAGTGDMYIPTGGYRIEPDEEESLIEHTKRIFAVKHSSIEIACRWLADASIRFKSDDKILDAVSGLETLMTAGIEDPTREIAFRFRIHYASLPIFKIFKEREKARRDVYDARSTVAHG